MDPRSDADGSDPVVSGLGHEENARCDAAPFLTTLKNRKYMGPQDDLAVVAASKAVASAGLAAPLGERAGLYVAVGYIPFEESDLKTLVDASTEDGAFSMRRFSERGFQSVHPFLTFRCLSNMPAFHVSVNLCIRGPYFVTYPGPGQFYLALEEARFALASDAIDVALVGGVAYQKNFLVEHHFSRVDPEAKIANGAGFLVLQRRAEAREVRAELIELRVSYRPHQPFEERSEFEEEGVPAGERGAASLPFALSAMGAGTLLHRLRARDGIEGQSTWVRR